jgi:hypothetical protein
MTRVWILALALTWAVVALPISVQAAPETHGGLAAPFSPGATIYRPDCIKEDLTMRWDVPSGCVRQ